MDKQSANKITLQYFKKIYGYSIKKCFSYDEAEELCAAIGAQLWVALLKTDTIGNPDGFVWQVCEHVYSKHLRAKLKPGGEGRRVSLYEADYPFQDDFSAAEQKEEYDRLRVEIAFLTKTRREIVYLHYFERVPIAEISRKLSLPVGTVKWHLNKARDELRKDYTMERKIGKLGLNPLSLTKCTFGHNGAPGSNGGPEAYLEDMINLNIVYSVYFTPRTKEEITDELGLTLVFIEDRINMLEENGFLTRKGKDKYTTYVNFDPLTFSIEQQEVNYKKQLEMADELASGYANTIIEAVKDIKDIYIPGGNRQLFEAAAIFYAIVNRAFKVDYTAGQKPYHEIWNKYCIHTKDGGEYIAHVSIEAQPSDPDYKRTVNMPALWSCGDMNRGSCKYPSVGSWSIDSPLCSRVGGWQNNLYTDYEYLYEYITGAISDTPSNASKFARLRERKFIDDSGRVNIMIALPEVYKLLENLPSLPDDQARKFIDAELEAEQLEARNYPEQMQDLILNNGTNILLSNRLAILVLNKLYENGTFKPLTENEKVTSQLIMFSDKLPE